MPRSKRVVVVDIRLTLRERFGESIADGRYPCTASPADRREWLDRRLNYLWSIPERTEAESAALSIASERMARLLEHFPELPTSGCAEPRPSNL